MELAYYPGCSLHGSSALYDKQCKIVFRNLGIELLEIEDWNCCVATAGAKTDDFLSMALPARNLGIADATGLSEVVIPCSACYNRMLVSQQRLSQDPRFKESINEELGMKVEGKIKVSNILEALKPYVESFDIETEMFKKLEGFKPACYYGCLLTRFPSDVNVTDDVENPSEMEAICKALGSEPVDWSYKTDCCGASASVNDTNVSQLLMSRIMQDASARGANCFVVTCPLCQFNLDFYQEDVGKKYGFNERLPVYFITEMIGLSMSMDPLSLQVDRHFTDALSLLRELKLI